MFTEERDRWDVLVGVIATAILIGGMYVLNRGEPGEVRAEPKAAEPTAENTLVIDGDRIIAPIPDASGTPIASVYECWRGEQRSLSDRPCGADASIREIAEPNRMDAQDTRGLYSPVHVSPQRSRWGSSAGQGAGTSSICDSIQAQIDRVNARMRHAYTNWEGEQFRDDLRELSRQRYEAKCIR
jgi:hypothetical protein